MRRPGAHPSMRKTSPRLTPRPTPPHTRTPLVVSTSWTSYSHPLMCPLRQSIPPDRRDRPWSTTRPRRLNLVSRTSIVPTLRAPHHHRLRLRTRIRPALARPPVRPEDLDNTSAFDRRPRDSTPRSRRNTPNHPHRRSDSTHRTTARSTTPLIALYCAPRSLVYSRSTLNVSRTRRRARCSDNTLRSSSTRASPRRLRPRSSRRAGSTRRTPDPRTR